MVRRQLSLSAGRFQSRIQEAASGADFKLRRDPQFQEKLEDIVSLYLNPARLN